MCVALPMIASLVLGVGQAAMGFMGDKAAAKAQNQQYKANLENTKKATFAKYDSINNRVLQEDAAASQELQEASIEGLRARSAARVAAEEGGVSGVSVNAIVGDIMARESRYATATDVNFDYSKKYWQGEGAAASAQGQSSVNSVPRAAKPSFLPYAINLFGSAIKGFS